MEHSAVDVPRDIRDAKVFIASDSLYSSLSSFLVRWRVGFPLDSDWIPAVDALFFNARGSPEGSFQTTEASPIRARGASDTFGPTWNHPAVAIKEEVMVI